jgi:peptidoglycan/xylan/chitin deacetylase (PgdA/CDA1 family)
MQEKIPVRIVIYAKDVINITGRKERAAWKMLTQITKKYKKEKGQFVTIDEFCEYTGIKEERVLPFLYN